MPFTRGRPNLRVPRHVVWGGGTRPPMGRGHQRIATSNMGRSSQESPHTRLGPRLETGPPKQRLCDRDLDPMNAGRTSLPECQQYGVNRGGGTQDGPSKKRQINAKKTQKKYCRNQKKKMHKKYKKGVVHRPNSEQCMPIRVPRTPPPKGCGMWVGSVTPQTSTDLASLSRH